MKCKQTLEDGDGVEDFFGVEVVAVVGVDVHGVAVGLCAVRGFDGQVLGRRIKVNAFDLPARTVFEHDAVAFTGVVVGDGARALPVQGVAAVQQVGEGVRACAAFLQRRAVGGNEGVIAAAAVLFMCALVLGRGEQFTAVFAKVLQEFGVIEADEFGVGRRIYAIADVEGRRAVIVLCVRYRVVCVMRRVIRARCRAVVVLELGLVVFERGAVGATVVDSGGEVFFADVRAVRVGDFDGVGFVAFFFAVGERFDGEVSAALAFGDGDALGAEFGVAVVGRAVLEGDVHGHVFFPAFSPTSGRPGIF